MYELVSLRKVSHRLDYELNLDATHSISDPTQPTGLNKLVYQTEPNSTQLTCTMIFYQAGLLAHKFASNPTPDSKKVMAVFRSNVHK